MPAALLIIDMQVGLFHGPEKPYQGERILANIQRLIAAARANQVPIFAVRHTGPDGSPIAAGSPFWQLLPALELDRGAHQPGEPDREQGDGDLPGIDARPAQPLQHRPCHPVG